VRVRAVTVAALAAAVVVGDAAPFRPLGARWSERTIRYHLAAPEHAWALERAVAAWNASGARIRFVRAAPARARLVISVRPLPPGMLGRAGFATRRGRILRARVDLAPDTERFRGALILAHELGHVLGLAHDDRRCATMNTRVHYGVGSPSECFVNVGFGKWFCRLLQADDVRGAVSLYGGRPRLPSGPPTCFKWQVPGPVEGLAAAVAGDAVLLTWTAPRSEGIDRVEIRRALDTCPGRGEGFWVTDLDAASGAAQSYEDGLAGAPPGRYCYAVFAVEEAGRAGPAATVWVDRAVR
jgi:hypothetical protein